ncbi:MAG TPA: hypothetical protein VLX91_13915 [Candidatus Acidoferrales bacterium]|nr:hypothetical protein [Candidatus Acidoferrales bacterium]
MRKALTIFVVFYSVSLAQTKYAASFLEIPVGAEALGMGDAFVSLADDGTAFHYNPSGTALIDSKILSMMYSSQYGSLFSPLSNFFFLGYAQKLQDLNVSVDWVRLSVDDIPSTLDLTEVESPALREDSIKSGLANTGSFSSADDAIYLNIARMFKFDIDFGWSLFRIPVQFPVGINFKIIHRSLYGRTASGVGIDGGFMLRLPFEEESGEKNLGTFSFGMNVRDVTNTRMAWDTQTNESIQRSLVWGVSYDAPIDVIGGDVVVTVNRDSRYGDFLIGGEYVYKNLLSVRVGSDASNITAGAGINLNFIRVDYAFLAQDLGNVNRVSASFYMDKIFK